MSDICEECGQSGECHVRGMSGGQLLCTACAADHFALRDYDTVVEAHKVAEQIRDAARAECNRLLEENRVLRDKTTFLRQHDDAMDAVIARAHELATTQLNAVYDERNRCVAALCSMAQRLNWSTWRGKHAPAGDPNWDAEWLNVVFINLPTGQVSWHIHDRDLPMFGMLPLIPERPWDGHTTEEKYKRLEHISYGPKHCVKCGVMLIQGPTALDRDRYEHLLCGGC